MNAYKLFSPDGKEIGSACGRCHQLACNGNFDLSEKCCACYECGLPLEKPRQHGGALYHPACERAMRAKAELRGLERAELVEDYDGPVECEGYGHGSFGDGYFANIDELAEHLDDMEGEAGFERPEFAYCCESKKVINLDPDDIIYSATEDAFEEADEHLIGTDEFKAACHAFNLANEGVLSYYPDYKRKVAIPPAQVQS